MSLQSGVSGRGQGQALPLRWLMDKDILFWLVIALYLVLLAPLAFRAVGDVRQVAALSPVSTDESRLVKMVMANLQESRFGAHKWYDYGGFYFMLCLATAYPLQSLLSLDEPTVLALSRLASTLCGALSLWGLYLLGRELFDRLTALLAVVILSASWVFVFWSVSDHPDVPQTLFLILALYGCVRLVKTSLVRWLWFAALCTGLVVSIKYVGLFMLPVIWLADGIRVVREVDRLGWGEWKQAALPFVGRCLAVALIVPLVFFVTTPYALVDLSGFLNRMKFVSDVASIGKLGVSVPGTVWLEEIVSGRVLGVVLFAFMLLYLVVFSIRYVSRLRGRHSQLDGQLVVLAWTALFFAYLYWRIDYHPPHYLLPIVPFLCLFAARGVVELLQIRWRPLGLAWVVRAVASLVLVYALVSNGQQVLAFWQERMSFSLTEHPTIRSGMWLEKAFPPDVKINYDASYDYIPKSFTKAQQEASLDADVIVISRMSAGTYDTPDLASGSYVGREEYLRMHDFYATLMSGERRPPRIVELRDFGSVVVYLNAEPFLGGSVRAQPHVGPAGLALPTRQDNLDAAYVFPAQAQDAMASFEKTWGRYAPRQEIRSREGELLAAAYRIRNADLPDAERPLELLTSPRFPLRLAHEAQARFAGGIELLGYAVERDQVLPDQPLEVNLYWRATAGEVPGDYTVFVHALDGARRVQGVGDRRPLDGQYPTDRWAKGDVIIDRFSVPLAPCAPAGPYYLEVGLYTLATGERLTLVEPAGMALRATAVVVGPFDLTPLGTVPADKVSPSHPLDVSLPAQKIRLIGLDPESETASGGQPFRFTLDWQAESDVTEVPQASLSLKPAGGESFRLWSGPVGGGKLTGLTWPAGQVVCQSIDVRLPEGLPVGQHELRLESGDRGAAVGALKVVERKGTFQLPEPAVPARVALEDRVVYLGCDGLTGPVRVGQTVDLVLYWQAARAMDESYKVFVHLVDPEGKIVTQRDSVPLNGEYPTRAWAAGEVVRDEYALTVPKGSAAGEYRLLAGMYDEVTGQRLKIAGSDRDAVLVGKLGVGL